MAFLTSAGFFQHACRRAAPRALAAVWLLGSVGTGLAVAQQTGVAGRVSWSFARYQPWTAPTIQVLSPWGQVVGSVTPAFADGATSALYSLPTSPGVFYVRATSPVARNWLGRGCAVSGDLVGELYDDVVCVAPDCAVADGKPVLVAHGATSNGIDFRLDWGASIMGQVNGGFPYLNRIEVYDSRGVLLADRVTESCVAFGGSVAVGLPTGAYYVRTRNSQGLVDQVYGFGPCIDCPVTAGQPVFVRAGEEVTLTFTLTAGGGISGTVRDLDTGSPRSGVQVAVYGSTGTAAGSAWTDDQGVYRVRPLVPGTYYALTHNELGYVDQLYGSTACAACGLTDGTPIVVPSTGDATGVDFALELGVAIEGTITDAAGYGLSGVRVSLFDSIGQLAGRTLAQSGRYTIAVPPGTYYVRTDAHAGFIRELFRGLPCPGDSCDVTAGTPVETASATVTGIDFSLDTCPGVSVSPLQLRRGAVGELYGQAVSATGGRVPYRFSLESGAFPPGLQLDAVSGVLSGRPTVMGTYPVTIGVVDGSGCSGMMAYDLEIQPCALELSPADVGMASGAGTGRIRVSGRCAWSAVSNDPWIVLTGSSAGTGTGAVDYRVAANPSAAELRLGSVRIGSRVATIRQAPTVSEPAFGVIDTPADGAAVTGAIPVTGWALDDVEVTKVEIYRDPEAGEPTSPNGKVYVGDGTFVEGARPDVARAYPRQPLRTRAGWGYMLLTYGLPAQGNGTYVLHAYAHDAEGHTTLLGSKTITCSNATATKPFGTIDTPGQGQTVSGSSYVVFGWALTPQPGVIPTDGSTIWLTIDEQLVAHSAYNQYRSDIATAFPGYANSEGAGGAYVLDTTRLANGIHTIAWLVTDDHGRAEGLGSRFFWVQN